MGEAFAKADIGIFPIISLLLFFIIFIVIIVRTYTTNKNEINKISNLPLEDN